jgi:hypothetical protein
MKDTIFLEIEFVSLVLCSVLLPCGIYAFLLLTKSVSRWAVLGLALLLISLSGVDVVLLQVLAAKSRTTPSLVDDTLFSAEMSVALYLLPAVFAGVGVNLISHLLTSHLGAAEARFERERSRVMRHQGHP